MAIKVKARGGESVEQMVRRFKKLCEKEGLTKEVKRRQYYEKPSETKRRNSRRGPRPLLTGGRAGSRPASGAASGTRAGTGGSGGRSGGPSGGRSSGGPRGRSGGGGGRPMGRGPSRG